MAWNNNNRPAEADSARPLMSMSAVVMDTETTGLDTAKDRIVQIGAVKLVHGKLIEGELFDSLVNPGIPIPPASTEIHGITDQDVAGAPVLENCFRDYQSWAGLGLLVGYSIGFDIAVIKAEHARLGSSWTPPRSLDVRHLVQLVAPGHLYNSLESVAAWLGLDIENRHTGLGDAIATAHIFQALIPHLAGKSIFTLAEAERAVAGLSTRISGEVSAGWHDMAAGRAANADPILARIDSFPYRHRVGDLMQSPPVFVAATSRISNALDTMIDKGISSVFVKSAKPDAPPGILTERDLLRALKNQGVKLLTQKVGTHCVTPLISVEKSEFVYKAISLMASRGFRHLGVHDESGDIVGALSARDLLRQRSQDAYVLGQEIAHATTPAQLARIWPELASVARGLVAEDVDGREVAAIISRELRGLTRKACIIAEREMAEVGKGAPPVPYAMLVLGSGGRGESLLAMDQDNAIVFETGAPGGPADDWFAELGKRVSYILDSVGVPYCNGGIMASNADWRMDVDGWRERVASWISRSKPEDIMHSDIFFDCSAVHGQLSLLDQVRPSALDAAGKSVNFLKLMAMNASEIRPMIGWFGRFKLKDGRLDLKRGGLMPIFSTARLLAVKYGSSARSTPKRLEAIRAHLEATAHVADNLMEAHRLFLEAILNQQLRDVEAGIRPSNNVDPATLSALDRQDLKWALEQVSAIPDLLGNPRGAV